MTRWISVPKPRTSGRVAGLTSTSSRSTPSSTPPERADLSVPAKLEMSGSVAKVSCVRVSSSGSTISSMQGCRNRESDEACERRDDDREGREGSLSTRVDLKLGRPEPHLLLERLEHDVTSSALHLIERLLLKHPDRDELRTG